MQPPRLYWGSQTGRLDRLDEREHYLLSLLRRLDDPTGDLLISTAENLVGNAARRREEAMPPNVYLICDPLRKFT